MKAWGAAEGKWKLPSWFLEKDLPWWREWGAAKPKRELPSWFLEEDLPWWSVSIHPCDEEFVDQWFARLPEEKGAKGVDEGHKRRETEKGVKKAKGVAKRKTAKATSATSDSGKDGASAPKRGRNITRDAK